MATHHDESDIGMRCTSCMAGAEGRVEMITSHTFGRRFRHHNPGFEASIDSPLSPVAAASTNTREQRFNKAFETITGIVGAERFTQNLKDRNSHSRDASYFPASLPDAVCYAMSAEEVSQIVKTCGTYLVPLVAWGLGTSLEAHSIPVHGGLVMDMSRMDQVVSYQEEDMLVTVGPGIKQKTLNQWLREKHTFFPIDPGSNPSIGGMTSTGSSGTTAVGYGTMRENVKSIKVVMADGTIIRTGSRAKKSSAGYDLTRLIIGSEGTLGIVCEITLRVYRIPTVIAAAIASFPTVADAANTVVQTLQQGVPVQRVELLNEIAMLATNKKFNLNYPVKPTLFLEFHGPSASQVDSNLRFFEKVAKNNSLISLEDTTEPKRREELWEARYGAYWASAALRPGTKLFVTDVCVPISKLAENVVKTEEEFKAANPPLMCPIVGHVGDGNFHCMVPVDVNSHAEMEEVHRLNATMVRRAIHCGGTCTGEHGIGMGKMEWLLEEHGPHAVEFMRKIKQALDPLGILNPGKLFHFDSQAAKL